MIANTASIVETKCLTIKLMIGCSGQRWHFYAEHVWLSGVMGFFDESQAHMLILNINSLMNAVERTFYSDTQKACVPNLCTNDVTHAHMLFN